MRGSTPSTENQTKENPTKSPEASSSVSYIADTDGKMYLNTPDVIARLKGEEPQLRDLDQNDEPSDLTPPERRPSSR